MSVKPPRVQSPETRERIRVRITGIKRTPETRARSAASHLANPLDEPELWQRIYEQKLAMFRLLEELHSHVIAE